MIQSFVYQGYCKVEQRLQEDKDYISLNAKKERILIILIFDAERLSKKRNFQTPNSNIRVENVILLYSKIKLLKEVQKKAKQVRSYFIFSHSTLSLSYPMIQHMDSRRASLKLQTEKKVDIEKEQKYELQLFCTHLSATIFHQILRFGGIKNCLFDYISNKKARKKIKFDRSKTWIHHFQSFIDVLILFSDRKMSYLQSFLNIIKAMTCTEKYKSAVRFVDQFSHTKFLYFDSDGTLCGAIASITLIIIYVTLILKQIVYVAYQGSGQITSSTNIFYEGSPSKSTFTLLDGSSTMFAITFQDPLTQDSYRKYFDVYGTQIDKNSSSTSNTIKFEPCRQNSFSYNSQTRQISSRSNLTQKALCPPNNTTYYVSGVQNQKNFSAFKIEIKKCKDRPQCADLDDANFTAMNVEVNFPFINTIITPGIKNYKSVYIQTGNFYYFSANLRPSVEARITEFEVNVDQDLMPYNNIKTQRIMAIPTAFTYKKLPNQYNSNGVYFQAQIMKSSEKYIYNQSVKKIDQLLIFIGGLMGPILSIFGLLKYYARASNLLDIAGRNYRYEKKEIKLKQKFNFSQYLKMALPCGSKDRQIKQYNQVKQGLFNELSINVILDDLDFLYRALSVCLTEDQINALCFQKKISIDQAAKKRQRLAISNKIIDEYDQQKDYKKLKSSVQKTQEVKELGPTGPGRQRDDTYHRQLSLFERYEKEILTRLNDNVKDRSKSKEKTKEKVQEKEKDCYKVWHQLMVRRLRDEKQVYEKKIKTIKDSVHKDEFSNYQKERLEWQIQKCNAKIFKFKDLSYKWQSESLKDFKQTFQILCYELQQDYQAQKQQKWLYYWDNWRIKNQQLLKNNSQQQYEKSGEWQEWVRELAEKKKRKKEQEQKKYAGDTMIKMKGMMRQHVSKVHRWTYQYRWQKEDKQLQAWQHFERQFDKFYQKVLWQDLQNERYKNLMKSYNTWLKQWDDSLKKILEGWQKRYNDNYKPVETIKPDPKDAKPAYGPQEEEVSKEKKQQQRVQYYLEKQYENMKKQYKRQDQQREQTIKKQSNNKKVLYEQQYYGNETKQQNDDIFFKIIYQLMQDKEENKQKINIKNFNKDLIELIKGSINKKQENKDKNQYINKNILKLLNRKIFGYHSYQTFVGSLQPKQTVTAIKKQQ